MVRFRRYRWIAITAVAATAVCALAIGAEAFADQSAARCATSTSTAAARGGQSWRTEGFRAAGCHAVRRMHRARIRMFRHGH